MMSARLPKFARGCSQRSFGGSSIVNRHPQSHDRVPNGIPRNREDLTLNGTDGGRRRIDDSRRRERKICGIIPKIEYPLASRTRRKKKKTRRKRELAVLGRDNPDERERERDFLASGAVPLASFPSHLPLPPSHTPGCAHSRYASRIEWRIRVPPPPPRDKPINRAPRDRESKRFARHRHLTKLNRRKNVAGRVRTCARVYRA